MTHVLKRAMESCVGKWSFDSGLVHSGGEFDSCAAGDTFGATCFGVGGGCVLGVRGA